MNSNIDNLDRKILIELDSNSRIPITRLAKKLRLSREVTKYRVNRLVETGIIKSFTTIINPAKFDFLIYKIYLKFQNLSLEKEKELIDFLNKDKNVFWLAKTEGSFDLISGIYVKTIVEFDLFISELIGKFGKYILSRHISNTVYSYPFKKKYLLDKQNHYDDILWGGTPQDEDDIDNISRNILRSIAENSRLSIVEICEKLNSTSKTIISKIKYMEKNKIILGYRLILDLNKINMQNFKAIIYFQNASPEKEKKFKDFCRTNPNIIYYIKTIGEWDVELDFEIENYNEFNKTLYEIKRNFGDLLKNIDSVHISEEFKGELNVVQGL